MTEKQQAILQSAVMEESELPSGDPEFLEKSCGYSIETEGGVELRGDCEWLVKEDNASIVLNLNDIITEGEVYVLMENVYFAGENSDDNSGTMDVYAGNVRQNMSIRNEHNFFYSGRHHFLINLGECKVSDKKIRIRLFMGLELEKGYHEIEFFYQTPFLFAGMIGAGLGLMILLAVILTRRTTSTANDTNLS